MAANESSLDEVEPTAPLIGGGGPPRPIASVSRARQGWLAATAALGIGLIVVGVLWASDRSTMTNQIASLSGQLSSANTSLADTQTQLDAANLAAKHPTLGINNSQQTIGANVGWLVQGLPDTFTYHLAFTSPVQIDYAFLSYKDYTTFATCDTSLFYMQNRAVSKLAGCISRLGGAYAQAPVAATNNVWGVGTSVSVDFHGAEGCAGWVNVMFPELANTVAVVTPNISVTYNPSQVATWPCA